MTWNPFSDDDETGPESVAPIGVTPKTLTAGELWEYLRKRTGLAGSGLLDKTWFSLSIDYDVDEDQARALFSELERDGYVVKRGSDWYLPETETISEPQPRTERPAKQAGSRKPPAKQAEKHSGPTQACVRPATEYRDPAKQNEHIWCLIDMSDLSPTERWVGTVMHYLCYADGNKGDMSPSRKLTADFVADKAGVSESTAKRAASKLVQRGLFARVDNGKGGLSRRNKTGFGARYRPVVPSWWNPKVVTHDHL